MSAWVCSMTTTTSRGLYDDIAIDEAEDRETEVARQRHEFEDWFGTHMGADQHLRFRYVSWNSCTREPGQG